MKQRNGGTRVNKPGQRWAQMRPLALALLLGQAAWWGESAWAQDASPAEPPQALPGLHGAAPEGKPPVRKPSEGKKPAGTKAKTKERAAAEASAKEPAGKVVPPLTQKRFYEVLLADVALQRREPVLATRTFLMLAEDTKSPWFAQRATESALVARDQSLLNKALATWQKLDPTSERPKRIQSQMARLMLDPLSRKSESTEMQTQLEALLQEAEANDTVGEVFLQINQFFAQRQDKIAVFGTVRELALAYPQQPEAHYAVALAAFLTTADKTPEAALSTVNKILEEGNHEIDLALAAVPDWDEALQLKVALMEKVAPEQMLPWLQAQIEKTPDKKVLWGLLARVYGQQKQYVKSREWFLKVWRDDGSEQALTAAAALCVKLNDRDGASSLLEEVRKKGGDEKANAVLILFAQVAEDEKRPMEAIDWFRQVSSGDSWWGVQLRIAVLMAQNGKRDDALTLLGNLPAVTLEERIAVVQTQARILRDAESWEAVQTLLEKSIKDFPESAELVSELALVEERRGNLKDAEKHLRAALKLQPDAPYVQNALGYTLVDHSINVEEGVALIEKAHNALPDDGAILDSMGWARYRQGRLEEALKYLGRAMTQHPDAEVAAHLGEVLWRLDRRTEARRVWQEGLQLSPRDTLIRSTMKRLNVDETTSAP